MSDAMVYDDSILDQPSILLSRSVEDTRQLPKAFAEFLKDIALRIEAGHMAIPARMDFDLRVEAWDCQFKATLAYRKAT